MLRFARRAREAAQPRARRASLGGGRSDTIGSARCSASTSAASAATTCASSCASPASTSPTCSKRASTTPLLKGALALDAVLGTNLGPRSNNSVLALLHRLSGQAVDAAAGLSLPEGGMGAVTEALAAAARAQRRDDPHRQPGRAHHARRRRVAGVELDDGEMIARRHRGLERRSRAHPARPARRPASRNRLRAPRPAFPHARAWPPSCISRSTACPSSAAAVRARRRAPRVAPDLVYLEHAFDPAKYGECSPEPGARDHDPDACTTYARARRQARAVGGRAVRAVRRAREHGRRRARELARAHARGARAVTRPACAGQSSPRELLLPADIEREFRITGGHWHHGELALDQFLMLRPVPGAAQYAMPVDGLYLCGAGCHPGGGVMGCGGQQCGAGGTRGGARMSTA